MSVEAPVKIKLRRVKPQINQSTIIDEDIILRNLQPLQENVQKKKKAQEAYYRRNESGVSPLMRDSVRRPVKARLGLMPFGTNTSALPPKMRLRRFNGARMNSSGTTGNNAIRMRKLRVNIAQERLNRIRSRNSTLLASSTPKKIRLRRLMSTPSVLPGPQNLKVEVVNNTSMLRGPPFKHRRFKQILNQHIQMEIMALQNNTETEQYWIEKVTPVATQFKMHDRFAQLS
ncbi:unnamed protein product [Callosobruchus maculatus]|uniref:Uncharacterized protein n=1 Tax=Callosobruchus maculatus TaxID=64391 RepID=A0A653CBV4_CALMS|nr:unnamed protein product [Callosobruchus maculatus]